MDLFESNGLIAEFMMSLDEDGVLYTPTIRWNPDGDRNFKLTMHDLSRFRFHTSWDWLMPVVDKIDTLTPNGRTFIEAQRDKPDEPVYWWVNLGETYSLSKVSKIDAVYDAVVLWIKWWNNKNKEDNEQINKSTT